MHIKSIIKSIRRRVFRTTNCTGTDSQTSHNHEVIYIYLTLT